jgi:hypothetical protein
LNSEIFIALPTASSRALSRLWRERAKRVNAHWMLSKYQKILTRV